MSENYSKVQQAFRILHPLLAGYVCQELRREYQDNWWQEVLMTLSDQVRDLPDDNGDYATLMDSLDIANCLRLFDRKWNDLFKRKLSDGCAQQASPHRRGRLFRGRHLACTGHYGPPMRSL